MDRYAGKPFLKLLECYILSAIGQLDEPRRAILHEMEPKLRSVYGVTGNWVDIVASQMDFPDSLPDQINSIWKGYLVQAKKQGLSVHPDEFVMKFVDENFPDL